MCQTLLLSFDRITVVHTEVILTEDAFTPQFPAWFLAHCARGYPQHETDRNPLLSPPTATPHRPSTGQGVSSTCTCCCCSCCNSIGQMPLIAQPYQQRLQSNTQVLPRHHVRCPRRCRHLTTTYTLAVLPLILHHLYRALYQSCHLLTLHRHRQL